MSAHTTSQHLAAMVKAHGGTAERSGEIIESFVTARGKRIAWRCPAESSRAALHGSILIQHAAKADYRIAAIDNGSGDHHARAKAVNEAVAKFRHLHDEADALIRKTSDLPDCAARNRWLQGVISQSGNVIDGLRR
jgi:hypothetical protein